MGPGAIGERSVAAFLLGFLALNAPILSIFNAEVRLFGIPLLYLYLFLVWSAVVVLTAMISGLRPRAKTDRAPEEPAGGPGGEAGRDRG
jgi:hypothetical protein